MCSLTEKTDWLGSNTGSENFASHASKLLVVLFLSTAAVTSFSTQAFAQPVPAQQPAPEAQNIAVRPNLNVTPKRLTFKKGERSATVYVYNQGVTPAVFDISMVDRVMLPSGEIAPVSDASKDPANATSLQNLKSANAFLVATPRRAVLAPGKGQTVRIRVTAPADASAAEYRSHLTVTTVPPRDVGMTAEQAAAAEQSGQLSFQVTSVFGISIPIIVRTGTPDVRAHIAAVRLATMSLPASGRAPKPTAVVQISLSRDGANSLFGNVEVRSRDKSLLGIARGVGVYPEIPARTIEVPLQKTPSPHETIDIAFIDDDLTPGRSVARTNFVVP